MLKHRIAEKCMRVKFKYNVVCDAEFSNVFYTGYKVILYVRDSKIGFKSYRDCVNYLDDLIEKRRTV